MNVEDAMRDLLVADVTVSGLVATRVYPMQMPQGATLPAITYQRVATTPHDDLELTQNHEWVRVQVDCWAANYAGAKALAVAVRAALQVTPVYAQLLMELDDHEPEEKLYRVIQDFRVWN